MRIPTQITLTSFLVLIGIAAPALALMPPHVTRTEPADGGTLEGDTITIHGYSLRYANLDEELKLTGAAKGEPVPATRSLTCEEEGRCESGSPPGACQLKCVLKLTLKETRPGRVLRLRFLRTDVTFTEKAAEKKTK